MYFKKKLFFYLIFCTFFPIILISSNSCAGAKSDFSTGWKEFHYLKKTPSKAKYRSYWMRTKRFFYRAYRDNPTGPYAPKSLYYLGRTYQELGKRSGLKKDLKKSLDYYQRMLDKFPSHSWSDDTKLWQAKIRLNYLHNKRKAYRDLKELIREYPESDKKEQAKDLLGSLDIDQDIRLKNPKKSHSSNIHNQNLKRLQGIRHWSSNEYTRVVLDLDKKTNYREFLLDPNPELKTPHRLVVDLNNTRLSPDVAEKISIQNGILKQVRTGQYRKNRARVVLDIKELEKYRAFSLQNPFRVVLDVYAPEQEKSLRERKKHAEV